MAHLEMHRGKSCEDSISGSGAGWKENAADSRLDTSIAGTH